MRTRHSILMLVVGATLAFASTAEARMVQADRSLPIRVSTSSHSSAALLRAMSLRAQAEKNFREEQLQVGGRTITPRPLRPDDRSGIHGAGLTFRS
jgi:hypothetical protein